jgi:hypothetical protein
MNNEQTAGTFSGRCHCGTVRYECTGRVLRFSNCHCPDCRRISGAAFSSALVVGSAELKVVAGGDHVVAYESSPGKHRCFCGRCGTHLYAVMRDRPGVVILRAGSLDADPGLRPAMHIWVAEKAPWYDIRDDLPQHPGRPS